MVARPSFWVSTAPASPTATALPSGIGSVRSALNETGYFGGMMQCCSTNTTTDAIINYGLSGTVSLQTDPGSSRLAATFTGGAHDTVTAPLEPITGWSVA